MLCIPLTILSCVSNSVQREVELANAVLVTSDYEGFGLAAIEALACDVPVLSTPVGIAPYALGGVRGFSA